MNPGRGPSLANEHQFASNLKIVGEFSSVQDFWRYFNHMRKADEIEYNANYHLFKTGIKPMWEDKVNLEGGKWVIQLKGGDKRMLNTYWQNLVLALIGEQLDDTRDEICGAVMSRRKNGDKIAVWNKTKTDQKIIMELGKRIRQVVTEDLAPGANPDFQMNYMVHKDSLQSGTSYSLKGLYTLDTKF